MRNGATAPVSDGVAALERKGAAAPGRTGVAAPWCPTAAQERLLDAALGPIAECATSFASWRAGRTIEDIDDGSARLFPLLLPRIAYLPADDPLLPVIRGYYRRGTWQAQLLRARAAVVLGKFAEADIPSLVLKGGVLGASYYAHPGLRPMSDYDVLVPFARAGDAIRSLLDAGWTCGMPNPERIPAVFHSASFAAADGFEFDLHWHLLPEACESAADDLAWAAAEPFAVNGVPSLALAPADLLVVVCAHGVRWAPDLPVRWIADALVIMERAGARLDWDRVVRLADAWHVVPHLRHALTYLAQRRHAKVPDRALQDLAAVRVPALDARTFTFLSRRPGLLEYIWRPWRRYRLRTRHLSAWSALPGFVTYLELTLGVRSAWRLPAEAVRRVLRWRRTAPRVTN